MIRRPPAIHREETQRRSGGYNWNVKLSCNVFGTGRNDEKGEIRGEHCHLLCDFRSHRNRRTSCCHAAKLVSAPVERTSHKLPPGNGELVPPWIHGAAGCRRSN